MPTLMEITKNPLCLCGCGNHVTKRKNTYIYNHHPTKAKWEKEHIPWNTRAVMVLWDADACMNLGVDWELVIRANVKNV